MSIIRPIGETTLMGENQVSLPAQGVRQLGWEPGDCLLVETLDGELMILMRRPTNWTEFFAGKLSQVFGNHDEDLAWLAEERRSWSEGE